MSGFTAKVSSLPKRRAPDGSSTDCSHEPREAPAYAELAVTTNFSFLRGASHPQELVAQANALGHAGIGIADRNSVAGVVRALTMAREIWKAQPGFRLLAGARLVFADDTPDILAYPQDRAAWARLTRLLSYGKRKAEKGDCILTLPDLLEWAEGLNLIVMPGRLVHAAAYKHLAQVLATLTQNARRHAPVWLAASMLYRGDDLRRLSRLSELSAASGVPLIAVNDVLYHDQTRRELQDVVTCIREHVTIDTAGRSLEANAERHLKNAAEMARLFAKAPDAIAQTQRFLARCNFHLDDLSKAQYPDELRQGYATAQEALVAFVEEGIRERFPNGLKENLRVDLNKELALVADLDYAAYFLTVHKIVKFARGLKPPILCQGRGSAANSIICYCLRITEVNPEGGNLIFGRFISKERQEPPDIDVDFEHERREEVIQHIYGEYSREHAGLTATVICYRGRSAIREVGKAFGLSDDTVGALARTLWGWSSDGVRQQEVRRAGLDPADKRLAKVIELAEQLIDTPRHLSQHVGGFVITRSRLDEVVPVENAAMKDRTVVEWDKDDLDALKLLKVDILALGMLSCLRRAFDLLHYHYPDRPRRSLSIQDEDKATYAMIQRADTIGVFQIESRAQMSMLPRLKPNCFYDLVIEVAIVRPGPIQGKMVHPYLQRRMRKEEVTYPSPSPEHGEREELKAVLHRTLGVPLFQEQAMQIAIVAAEFAPGMADQLRRSMATFKRVGTIGSHREAFVSNMIRRGYPPDFAKSCFDQIEGFGGYGFPESHAASFANLVYASCWMKCRYPDVFAAALLNSQPMGFYAPSQIVRDAIEHGVETRAPDVNFSDWDCTLEHSTLEPGEDRPPLNPRHAGMEKDIRGHHALRLGFRLISGFLEKEGHAIAATRGAGFDSVRDLWLRTGLQPAAMERLASADAFRSLGLDRRAALWAVRALRRAGDKEDLPLFARVSSPSLEPDVALPPMRLGEHVVADYRHLHLSLKAHPVSFLRGELNRRGIARHEHLLTLASGARVTVGGLVLVRQRPGSAKGVIFMTMEDETGVANAIVWPKVFEAFRPVVLGARLVAVTGRLQSEHGVIHVVAERLDDLTSLLDVLTADHACVTSLAHCDEVARPNERAKADRPPRVSATAFSTPRMEDRSVAADLVAQVSESADLVHGVMPKGRNFH